MCYTSSFSERYGCIPWNFWKGVQDVGYSGIMGCVANNTSLQGLEASIICSILYIIHGSETKLPGVVGGVFVGRCTRMWSFPLSCLSSLLPLLSTLSLSLPPLPQTQLVFVHSNEAKVSYSLDQGATFTTVDLTPSTLDTTTVVYHPTKDGWMLMQDGNSGSVSWHWFSISHCNVIHTMWACV